MIGWLVIAAAAFLWASAVLDYAARKRHWRVGRYGRLLCFFQWRHGRKGAGCYRCGTDWRWALPHDTPIRAEDGYAIFPLCETCWTETPKPERFRYYGAWLRAQRDRGAYPDQATWDDTRTAVYFAVEAGL